MDQFLQQRPQYFRLDKATDTVHLRPGAFPPGAFEEGGAEGGAGAGAGAGGEGEGAGLGGSGGKWCVLDMETREKVCVSVLCGGGV